MRADGGGSSGTPTASRVPERRRHARRRGLWVAQLETAGGEQIPALLVDVSEQGGGRLVPRRPVALGTVVTLTAPACGKRRARVVWTTKSHIGLQFTI
jgi:hypothetical protein